MPSTSPARPGTAALLVLTATTGALLAFGWRDGEPGRAFRQTGRMLLAAAEFPGARLPLTAVLMGSLHHLAVACVWGALLGLACRAFRGWRFALAALVLGVTYSLLNLWLIPPMFGVGYGVVTSLGRALPLGLAIAVALLVTPWASGVPERPSVA